MATNASSISELCTRVEKLVPRSVGNETWYLIVVSQIVLLSLMFGCLFSTYLVCSSCLA